MSKLAITIRVIGCLILFIAVTSSLFWWCTRNITHSTVAIPWEGDPLTGNSATFSAKVYYGSEGNDYAVWHPKRDEWLFIMLPGTNLGMTLAVWDPETKEFKSAGSSKGSRGGPTTTESYEKQCKRDEKNLAEALDEITIHGYAKMTDGNYVVYRRSGSQSSPMFTVWAPDFFEVVLHRQLRREAAKLIRADP